MVRRACALILVSAAPLLLIPHAKPLAVAHRDVCRSTRTAMRTTRTRRPTALRVRRDRDSGGAGGASPPPVTDDEIRDLIATNDQLATTWNAGVPQPVRDVSVLVRALLVRALEDRAHVSANELAFAETWMIMIRRWRTTWHGFEPIPSERARQLDALQRLRHEAERRTPRGTTDDVHPQYASVTLDLLTAIDEMGGRSIADVVKDRKRDHEPAVDPDEVRAVIAEIEAILVRTGDRGPPASAPTARALLTALQRWLSRPGSVDVDELLFAELQGEAYGEWWLKTHGHDPNAATRARCLELLRRMRAIATAERITRNLQQKQNPARGIYPARVACGGDPTDAECSPMAARIHGDPPKPGTLGYRILEHRVRIERSQGQLAADLGMGRSGQSRVSDWEHNRVTPGLSHLIRLAQRFDITVDELLGEKCSLH